MQIRPTAFTIGLIIHFSIALFCVYTEFGIDSLLIHVSPAFQILSAIIITLISAFVKLWGNNSLLYYSFLAASNNS